MSTVSRDSHLITQLAQRLTEIISETNGIALADTLELLSNPTPTNNKPSIENIVNEFRELLAQFQQDAFPIHKLLEHPLALGLFEFFKRFPLPYREEHIHLTGSLSPEFVFPRLQKLLEGPNKKIYEQKIAATYGATSLPIRTIEDIRNLMCLKDHERFSRYLEILLLPKLILTDRQTHKEAAYTMSKELYERYNVGMIRLKFTLSRDTNKLSDQIPGLDDITPEDVILGLYDGFMQFKREFPSFQFVLSPSFRKEASYFNAGTFSSKKAHFAHQVDQILGLIQKFPELAAVLKEVDTVGDERDLYRKEHFTQMQPGLRKLQYKGFHIRSHHGETWYNLRKGIQAVDNAMNIWHIDTLEHGLSLGINPNYYFHSLFQRVLKENQAGQPIDQQSLEFYELNDMDWREHNAVKDKLVAGIPLHDQEITIFLKTKFHTAREIEYYQHDVLNRMISKKVSLVALPSSNKKLTDCFADYKDHPFSWWEKKGVLLGVGTDNYVTLNTNFIQEMLILLFTDPSDLKITKLLMVTTGETRRPYISQLLWKMRSAF